MNGGKAAEIRRKEAINGFCDSVLCIIAVFAVILVFICAADNQGQSVEEYLLSSVQAIIDVC